MEFVDINIAPDGSAIRANDKIALIDADTIAYTACVHNERAIDLLPKEFYTEAEWADLMKLGEPDENGRLYDANFSDIMAYADSKINKILTYTGCKGVELHFTNGKDSFRYQLYPEYKSNRKGLHTPVYLYETKLALCKKYVGKIHTKIEADDAVVYLARKYAEKYILCAVDKDVLNAVEGRHFNYYESASYNISMDFIMTSAETARLFPYRQALTGDKSDNIIGIHGIGKVKAATYIPDGTKNPMKLLIEIFKQNDRTEEEAKLNFELCYMGDERRCDGNI